MGDRVSVNDRYATPVALPSFGEREGNELKRSGRPNAAATPVRRQDRGFSEMTGAGDRREPAVSLELSAGKRDAAGVRTAKAACPTAWRRPSLTIASLALPALFITG